MANYLKSSSLKVNGLIEGFTSPFLRDENRSTPGSWQKPRRKNRSRFFGSASTHCAPTVPRRKVQREVQRRKGPRRKVPRKKVPRRKVRKVKERIEKSNNSGVSTFLSLSRNCWLKYRFSPVPQSQIFCFVSAIRFCPCCVPTVPRKRVRR